MPQDLSDASGSVRCPGYARYPRICPMPQDLSDVWDMPDAPGSVRCPESLHCCRIYSMPSDRCLGICSMSQDPSNSQICPTPGLSDALDLSQPQDLSDVSGSIMMPLDLSTFPGSAQGIYMPPPHPPESVQGPDLSIVHDMSDVPNLSDVSGFAQSPGISMRPPRSV
jgi:hypothetical protein